MSATGTRTAGPTANRAPEPRSGSRPSPRVYRRRRIVVFSALAVVLALLVSGGVYTSNALGAPIPSAAPQVTDPAPVAAAPQPLALPGFGTYAVGAVGFDGLLAAGSEQQPMAMASLAKVITALVVLDAHPVAAGEGGPDITYTEDDVDIYWDQVAQNSSVAPVVAGSTLSLRESLEAMLLPSGGNYSISIANWAFGSVDGYLAAARTWLDAHGLVNTRLVDTSGLSLDDVSTAAELVELGKLALADPTVAEIVALPSVEVPEIGTLKNSNKLLGTHGVDGIKTGTTDDAANLLFSADYPVGSSTVTVVGVLLGGETHAVLNEAIAALLDSVAPGFHEVSPLQGNEVLAEYGTPWGDTARARTTDGATVVVWNDTPVDVEVRAEPLTLASRGDEVGTAVVHAGTQEITVPLVLDASLEEPGAWWRLSNPGALDAPKAAQSGNE